MTNLTKHNRSLAHLKMMTIMNIDSSSDPNNSVDNSDAIKVKDIKEELTEEESAEDFLSIHQETENNKIYEDIKEEIKEEEENVDVSLPTNQHNDSGFKEIKEEVKESDEVQGVENSNLDTDHPVDCSQFVQVQMHLTK